MSGTPASNTAPTLPRLGPVGTARFVWRQLTSMRTALFLLLLLAVAAVPGSVLPQRGINAGQVSAYLQAHPTLGPWLDRIGGFDVYSSVWFSAIYLLLFVSLVGCVLPRTRQHLRAITAPPPPAPRRFERLPVHRRVELDADPAPTLQAAQAALRSRHYRLLVAALPDGGHEVSAERGRLRETGNLVFHLSLVLLLVAVAAGHLLGWRGDVIVPVGATFSDAAANFDTIDPGPWVNTENLPPFSVSVRSMTVRFDEQATGSLRGAPREFQADVTSTAAPGARERPFVISVNHPLQLDGAKVYLLGNGYAPVITVRDAKGQVLYSDATPFLPQDGNYTSVGVVKVAGAQPQQIGLNGLFLPTVAFSAGKLPVSIFPDDKNPALALMVFVGNLGDSPSVYTLDQRTMSPVKNPDGSPVRLLLSPGQQVDLPGGRGSVTFERVERFAGLSVRHDPGRVWALFASIAAMVGLSLSLFVPRRRVFLRARPVLGDDGVRRTVVEVAALARGEDTGLDDELDRLLRALDPPHRQPTLQEAPA